MRLARWIIGLLLGLWGLSAGAALAETAAPGPAVALRIGDHSGFGRLVFDLPNDSVPTVTQQGDRLVIRFVAMSFAAGERPTPRNVRSVVGSGSAAEIAVAPGATPRWTMMEHRLVIDVADPPRVAPVIAPKAPPPQVSAQPVRPPSQPPPASAPAPPPVPPKPAPAPPAPKPGSAPESPPPPDAHAAAPAATVSPPAPSVPAPQAGAGDVPATASAAHGPPESAPAQGPAPAAAGPIALAASAKAPADRGPGHLLEIPFTGAVGAASFQRGSDAVVVFDDRRPVDIKPLHDDPVFGTATVQLLPEATVLRLRLPPGTELRLDRKSSGWSILALGGDAVVPPVQPIRLVANGDQIGLPATNPGRVVSVPDTETGGILLVGTQRQPGQGVAVARRGPDFALLPSWQGVVVEPLSDTVVLRPSGSGFTLQAGGSGQSLVSSMPDPVQAMAESASRMSRQFDFPDLPTSGLLRRLQGSVVAAAAAPPRGKAEPRQRVAEAMLALGLSTEALGALEQAALADGRAASDPRQIGLTAVAGLLSGRSEKAEGLDDPRLSGSDEIELWRAVRDAMRNEGSPTAAQGFAALTPLLLSYPRPLRDRLLPLAAETMALGGQTEAVEKLLEAGKDAPAFDLARAFLRETGGAGPDEALALYDRLAKSPDRLVRLRAAQRAAELRLATGKATPKEAAAVLSKLLYAWRGDDREFNLRLRVAELQGQAGEARAALKLLRETEEMWPDRRGLVHGRLTSTLAQALDPNSPTRLSPFDLVALAEENADLMPDGEAGRELAERLVSRLADLDLPARAAPMLEKLIKSGPPGIARAVFGGRLAELRQQIGDPAGAIAALMNTVTESLPQGLLESRTLTFAEAVAAQGDMVSADRAITALDTPAGDQLRARLKEATHDWPGAVKAWQAVTSRSLPKDGKLSEDQAQLVVRLASAAAQAGDERVLTGLRETQAARLPKGPSADLLALLTSQAVRDISDLAAITRDVALTKAVPAALRPMASAATKPSS